MPPALRCAGGSSVAIMILLVAIGCGTPPRQQATTSSQTITVAWHLRALHADPMRSEGRGTGQTIAFVDTGFDESLLQSFDGRVVSPWNALSQTAEVSSDPNGHGTAMAVIAAGDGDDGVWGLAPSANVMPITVADQYGHATPAAVASGVRWAVDHHATVINISMASMIAAAEVTREIARAIAFGIPVVAAAGDLGAPGPEFPASLPGVLAVYGQDRNGNPGAHSNTPDRSGVLAPGEAIESLSPDDGTIRKQRVNGTSAAAAVVSGILAACLSAAPATAPADRLCVTLLVVHPPDQFLDVLGILKEVA
jgi:membrane-anchored mycosin MYCP